VQETSALRRTAGIHQIRLTRSNALKLKIANIVIKLTA
jgi:hypothetical protein